MTDPNPALIATCLFPIELLSAAGINTRPFNQGEKHV
jgi:hypothetical protein